MTSSKKTLRTDIEFLEKLVLRYLKWKKDPIQSAKDCNLGCNLLPVGGFWKLNERSAHPDIQNHVTLIEVVDHARKVLK